jgi:hypothetical protein
VLSALSARVRSPDASAIVSVPSGLVRLLSVAATESVPPSFAADAASDPCTKSPLSVAVSGLPTANSAPPLRAQSPSTPPGVPARDSSTYVSESESMTMCAPRDLGSLTGSLSGGSLSGGPAWPGGGAAPGFISLAKLMSPLVSRTTSALPETRTSPDRARTKEKRKERCGRVEVGAKDLAIGGVLDDQ